MKRLYCKSLTRAFLCVWLVSFSALAQPEEVRHNLKGQFAPFALWRLFEKHRKPVVDIPERGLAMHHRPATVNIDFRADNMRYGTSSENPVAEGQNLGADAEFKNSGILTTEGKEKKEVQVTLRFSDDRLVVSDRKASKIFIEISYASIIQTSYEFAKRHRVVEAAALMVISAGAGVILMTTKTKSHWLAVEYKETDQDKMVILHLDKGEYRGVINAIEAKTGKKVEMLGESGSKIVLTQGSKNVDKIVNYDVDRVRVALKHAMENFGCSITKETKTEIQCKRAWGETVQEIYGVGGEKVTAKLEAKGSQTRVRIETGKGLMGRAVKKNWSTPIFNEMIENIDPQRSATGRSAPPHDPRSSPNRSGGTSDLARAARRR